MKKMKKLFAVILSLAMVLGMTVTASAAAGEGKTTDSGTITISNVEEGATVTLYKILKADYEGTNGLFSGYSFEKAAYGTILDAAVNQDGYDKGYIQKLKDEENKGNAGNPNVGLSSDVVSQLRKAIPADAVAEATAAYTNGNYTATVPVGMYLVTITSPTTTIYSDVIASVYYEDGYAVEGGTVDVKGDNVYVKASGHPTVEKEITDADEANKSGSSANVGDEIPYSVTINPIPYYSGVNPILKVTDTLSGGLKLVQDSVEIKVYEKDSTEAVAGFAVKDANITKADKSLTVDFVDETDGYILNPYAGGKVVITYRAELTADAVKYNYATNSNDVTLEYSKDSNTEGVDGKQEDKDKTYTYTFDIDGAADGDTTTGGLVTKVYVDENGEKQPLSGATFTLYTADPTGKTGEALENIIYKNDALIVADTNPEGKAIAVSDGTGKLAFKGLKADTYYLQETQAPENYSLNTHVFVIQINATYYNGEERPSGIDNGAWNALTEDEKADVMAKAKGMLKTWSYTIDGSLVNTFTVSHTLQNGAASATGTDGGVTGAETFEIVNTTLSELPSTGGIGTTIFTIAGCVIMIAAVALFFASRRKAAK